MIEGFTINTIVGIGGADAEQGVEPTLLVLPDDGAGEADTLAALGAAGRWRVVLVRPPVQLAEGWGWIVPDAPESDMVEALQLQTARVGGLVVQVVRQLPTDRRLVLVGLGPHAGTITLAQAFAGGPVIRGAAAVGGVYLADWLPRPVAPLATVRQLAFGAAVGLAQQMSAAATKAGWDCEVTTGGKEYQGATAAAKWLGPTLQGLGAVA